MKPIKNQPETSCACFVLSLVIKSSVDVCQHIIIYAHGEAHLTLGQALRGELFYLQSSELYLDDVNSVPLIEVNENIEKEILSFSFLFSLPLQILKGRADITITRRGSNE
jgi:hypothetical protein